MSKRVLAIDPGAVRCGFSVLDFTSKKKEPESVGLGFFGIDRKRDGKKIPYQQYRFEVIDLWIDQANALILKYQPNELVAEIVPPVGSDNFVIATQSQLAATAITTIQVIAKQYSIPLFQIGATTVKKKIGGNKKATKVAVRNGVFQILPELERFKKEWVSVFDVSDAVAIGLTHLGYRNGT